MVPSQEGWFELSITGKVLNLYDLISDVDFCI